MAPVNGRGVERGEASRAAAVPKLCPAAQPDATGPVSKVRRFMGATVTSLNCKGRAAEEEQGRRRRKRGRIRFTIITRILIFVCLILYTLTELRPQAQAAGRESLRATLNPGD